MTLLEQYMADYQRVCAEKVVLQEQLEAANARKDELWTRLLDMENKYMDAYQRASDATEQYTRLLEQFDTLLRAAVSVRDSWLLYEADVDEAHLTNACSDLDQLIGGSPEWVAMVERLHSNPASVPENGA